MTLRSYDLNSNISALSRHGFQRKKNIAKYYGLLDSLVIYRGGNQPRMITDMATTDYGHPAEYRDGAATWYEHNHDKNGNLVCDLDRGVTSIGYNVLNLPEKVLLPGNHETYNIYDADGRKLRTVHIVIYDEVVTPGGETITPSDTLVRDYSGGHIYENGVLERIITPNGYYADGKYFYYIKDYQGNNVAVVTRTNNVADVVSATLMYPFGGELTELHATDRYRFGGKELDTRGGLFHYDFDARWYDPVFPAFTSVDPMAEKYPHLSPYAYCAGNPIRYVDPSGMTAHISINDEEWQIIRRDDGFVLVNINTNEDYMGDDSFANSVINGLSYLSQSYSGSILINEILNNDKEVEIREGIVENRGGAVDDYGNGSVVEWLPNLNSGGISSFWYKTTTEIPSAINLSHELAHIFDRFNGTYDKSVWIEVLPSQENGLTNPKVVRKAEIFACRVENMIRKELGLPIRTHYLTTDYGKNPYEFSRVYP